MHVIADIGAMADVSARAGNPCNALRFLCAFRSRKPAVPQRALLAADDARRVGVQRGERKRLLECSRPWYVVVIVFVLGVYVPWFDNAATRLFLAISYLV